MEFASLVLLFQEKVAAGPAELRFLSIPTEKRAICSASSGTFFMPANDAQTCHISRVPKWLRCSIRFVDRPLSSIWYNYRTILP